MAQVAIILNVGCMLSTLLCLCHQVTIAVHAHYTTRFILCSLDASGTPIASELNGSVVN